MDMGRKFVMINSPDVLGAVPDREYLIAAVSMCIPAYSFRIGAQSLHVTIALPEIPRTDAAKRA